MNELIDVELTGLNVVFRKLDRLLPPAELRKFLRKLARKAITLNKRRIKKQENLDGSKFDKRKSGSGMMLENVFRQSKRKQYKTTIISDNRVAQVQMLNPVTRRIHYGIDNVITLRDPAVIKEARKGLKNLSGPCTDEQARLLKSQMGFKHPTNYLKSRFTAFAAERVLLKHYNKHGGKKELQQAERHVLGINEDIEAALFDTARKELHKIIPSKI